MSSLPWAPEVRVGWEIDGKMNAQPGSIRTVLVVDDEPALLKAFSRVLQGHGFEVAIANGAEEALALLDARQFDAVITDHDMPGQNGLWLLMEMRARHPVIRRVLTSGREIDGIEEHLASGLVHQFVEKAAGTERLVSALLGSQGSLNDVGSSATHDSDRAEVACEKPGQASKKAP